MAKGELYINGIDAYQAWGLSFEDGAISALMTPAPVKDYITNSSRLQHGTRYVVEDSSGKSVVRLDSREITLPMHIIAKSKQDFYDKYSRFCTDVLSQGVMNIETCYQNSVVYKTYYHSCTQFTQFVEKMAKFTLKVVEPNPNDRS